MRRLAALALGLATSTMLTGCIAAAAIPLAAGGAIAKKHGHRDGHQTAPAPSPTPTPGAPDHTPGVEPFQIVGVVKGGMPVPGGPVPVVQGQAAPAKSLAGMQFLYGSGEGAAMSLQAYQILWSYLAARAEDRKAGLEIRGVVLSKDATLEVPKFVPCGKKPLAVVLDIDETALLNLGYEADDAVRDGPYDESRWQRWEATGADKVAAVPGAVETLESARRVGVTVVFNSNRSVANAAQTVAALEGAGLGHAELGKTLWLRGDGPGSSGKDARRWEIAAKYCVVALVGDQLGDFTDLFNPGGVPVPIRRNMASQTMVAAMWGLGWFMLPNPVYGTGLHGSLDEIFPLDKRWTDPGPAPAPAPAAIAPPTETTKPQ
jgi:5'-nucleotidase (lipoprotein e(P4) family)